MLDEQERLRLEAHIKKLNSSCPSQSSLSVSGDCRIDLSFISSINSEDIIRGMIYSEVLGRPAAKRRGRW